MSLQIESAPPEAAPAVIELIHRVFDEYGFIWDPEDEFWDLLAEPRVFPYIEPRGALWVMRDADALVVGSIAAERLDPETVELHRLYLDADLRGQGLGRRLLETAVDWARAGGAQMIELWSDTRFQDAHRLYERLGYIKTDSRELNDVNHTVEFKYEHALAGTAHSACFP